MATTVDRIKAVMLGHAVADALGVPVEFCTREELERQPITDMRGFGTYPVPPGAWSDDTSMSLAALDALTHENWSWATVMQGFSRWYKKGEYTPTGLVFDIGGVCRTAISRFDDLVCRNGAGEGTLPSDSDILRHCGPGDERSNGNGSLMRMNPFVLYAYCRHLVFADWRELIENASSLTHAHERSIVGCLIYAFVLMHLLHEPDKRAVAQALHRAEIHLQGCGKLSRYGRIFAPDFANVPRNGIKSSGYAVDTLEAALWCLLTTDSYRDCVLQAVNLGEDTDTVAAVAGGLAGALYGYEAIPRKWLDTLLCRDRIEQICARAATAWNR